MSSAMMQGSVRLDEMGAGIRFPERWSFNQAQPDAVYVLWIEPGQFAVEPGSRSVELVARTRQPEIPSSDEICGGRFAEAVDASSEPVTLGRRCGKDDWRPREMGERGTERHSFQHPRRWPAVNAAKHVDRSIELPNTNHDGGDPTQTAVHGAWRRRDAMGARSEILDKEG